MLALAGAFVHCAQNSEIALRVHRTSLATRLPKMLLVHIAEAVAVDATKLPLFGLEVPCMHIRGLSLPR